MGNLKTFLVADSNCDENNRENVSTEGRFDLIEENEGENLSIDYRDEHYDDVVGNRSCNIFRPDLENLMFLFSFR